jgi:hypothetical protein
MFPRIIKVAVPSPQHSAILGQLPEEQIVLSLYLSTNVLKFEYFLPVGNLTLIHLGLDELILGTDDFVSIFISDDIKAFFFCGVKTGRPSSIDWAEPEKVAKSIQIMNMKHGVITSVDRDDLKDMGSIIWAETVKAIRRLNPKTTLETLIPDFQGNLRNIDRIINVAPEVVSHNVETVRRLTIGVRIQAKYDRSLIIKV